MCVVKSDLKYVVLANSVFLPKRSCSSYYGAYNELYRTCAGCLSRSPSGNRKTPSQKFTIRKKCSGSVGYIASIFL